jgi:hypothetical protein
MKAATLRRAIERTGTGAAGDGFVIGEGSAGAAARPRASG